jgi:hypothetical protein
MFSLGRFLVLTNHFLNKSIKRAKVLHVKGVMLDMQLQKLLTPKRLKYV